MDGVFSTLVMLLLGAALCVTLYLLFREKPTLPLPNRRKSHLSEPSTTEGEDYHLHYAHEEEHITKGPKELVVTVYNVNRPQQSVRSVVYHDNDLISNYITIGRDRRNTYQLCANNIDRVEAIYLAKSGEQYLMKANPQSKNGLSTSFMGERIDKTITFEEQITVYMGEICLSFATPDSESAAPTGGRAALFSDVRPVHTPYRQPTIRRKADPEPPTKQWG